MSSKTDNWLYLPQLGRNSQHHKRQHVALSSNWKSGLGQLVRSLLGHERKYAWIMEFFAWYLPCTAMVSNYLPKIPSYCGYCWSIEIQLFLRTWLFRCYASLQLPQIPVGKSETVLRSQKTKNQHLSSSISTTTWAARHEQRTCRLSINWEAISLHITFLSQESKFTLAGVNCAGNLAVSTETKAHPLRH